MQKFITGLRYGNWLTRLYVIAIPVLFLIGVGCVIASFILNHMILFLVGVACLIGMIALILNYNIDEEDVEDEEEQESVEEASTAKEADQVDELEEQENTAKPAKERKKKEKKQRVKKERVKKEKQKKQKRSRPEVQAEDELEESDDEVDVEDQDDIEIDNLEDPETLKTPVDNTKREEDELLQYDEKRLKQVFYKYKVKKDHKLVMIDNWEERGIRQMPAYVWMTRGQMHFLVVGKSVEVLNMPTNKAAELKYVKGVVCQMQEEYPQFRGESLLKLSFSQYLPVYHEGHKNNRPIMYKNLFEISGGPQVTNTSARVIKDMLQPVILVDDIVMRDVRHNDFFKEIYKLGVLFREQVMTSKEYQDAVNDVLQNYASSMPAEDEYFNTLQALYQNKLITEEYIQFYMTYLNKMQMEELTGENSQGKKKKKKKVKKGS